MGQHLQLYATDRLKFPIVKDWCKSRLIDRHNPAESVVDEEMRRIEQEDPECHLEHWSAGGGVACFSFLDLEAHLCDRSLIDRARAAGRDYRAKMVERSSNSWYAKHDWENDEVIAFLERHQGKIVWGYNDGV